MTIVATGVLAGWKRRPANHGIALTLQVAASPRAYERREFDLVQLALNDRQLRSLARDLARASEERGLTLFARLPRWRRLLHYLARSAAVKVGRGQSW